MVAGVLLVFAETGMPAVEAPSPAPDFKEVYELVRAHLAGVTDADLNRAAVQGLVAALGPRVTIVGRENAAESAGVTPLVSRARVFDGGIAYLRIGRVAEGLGTAVQEAYGQIEKTNAAKGLVLDLRFAGGNDYASVVQVADLFVKKERPLLDWGKGVVQSKENADAITVPVGVLVNRRTGGAAEALAAVLRETGAGLIFGSRTEGTAMIAQEYPLKDGGRLRIATAPIQLADGSALSAEGLKPDIAIMVGAREEEAYFANAYEEVSRTNLVAGGNGTNTLAVAGNTNRARRIRLNEAELVRERRDGIYPEATLTAGRAGDTEAPQVRDPVLARALDVLKGLAVVRAARS